MSTQRTILATLTLDTALHIGTGKGGKPTDAPLRRTAGGRLFLPGRAIGGSLRTLATRLAPRLGFKSCKALMKADKKAREACLCTVCQLFGDLSPSEEDAGEKGGAASRLWISDAFPIESNLQTHIRDGVGISRRRGAAARHVKFDHEVLPRHTSFELRLKWDDDNSEEAAKRGQLLAATLAEWEAGRGQLGGNVARGLGRFHLEKNIRCIKRDIHSADDLLAYLRADKPWEIGKEDNRFLKLSLQAARKSIKEVNQSTSSLSIAHNFITVTFTIAFDTPFLINDPLVATLIGFDHAPLVEVALISDGNSPLPVLPGSSLRGVLRTRAEKIARTLATLHWQTREAFLKNCPACDPLANSNNDNEPLESCDHRLINISTREEVPQDALCLSCQLFGSPRQGSRLLISDAHWANPSPNEDDWKAQDFLAIDRFTGGGQDKAKFDAAPLVNAKFSASLTLHNPRHWELGWLVLILRDLAEGELTIGFGAAKGYGQAHATDFEWNFGYLTPNDFPSDSQLLTEAEASGVYNLVQAKANDGNWLPVGWQKQAQSWIDRFNRAIREFEPANEWEPFQDDSFFDKDGQMLELYGLPHTYGGADE